MAKNSYTFGLEFRQQRVSRNASLTQGAKPINHCHC